MKDSIGVCFKELVVSRCMASFYVTLLYTHLIIFLSSQWIQLNNIYSAAIFKHSPSQQLLTFARNSNVRQLRLIVELANLPSWISALTPLMQAERVSL